MGVISLHTDLPSKEKRDSGIFVTCLTYIDKSKMIFFLSRVPRVLSKICMSSIIATYLSLPHKEVIRSSIGDKDLMLPDIDVF